MRTPVSVKDITDYKYDLFLKLGIQVSYEIFEFEKAIIFDVSESELIAQFKLNYLQFAGWNLQLMERNIAEIFVNIFKKITAGTS